MKGAELDGSRILTIYLGYICGYQVCLDQVRHDTNIRGAVIAKKLAITRISFTDRISESLGLVLLKWNSLTIHAFVYLLVCLVCVLFFPGLSVGELP